MGPTIGPTREEIMASDGVIVLISYRAHAGQEEAARTELARLVSTVLSEEPACTGITILQDSEDPARITLVEYWPTRESYLGPHMETPHIRAFIQRAGELVIGPPDISFWREIDPS